MWAFPAGMINTGIIMVRGLCGCSGTDTAVRCIDRCRGPLVIRQGSANSSRATIRTVQSACVLHMGIIYDSPVSIAERIVLARQAFPIRSITNTECELAMYACINTHKHIHT